MENFNIKIDRVLRQFYVKGVYFSIFYPWFKYQVIRAKNYYLPAFRKSNQKENKNGFRILIELIYLLIRERCIPFHYFHYGLYRKMISIKQLREYIPETKFYYSYLNKLNWNYCLLDDKDTFESICTRYHIPIPKTIAKIRNGMVFSGDGHQIYSLEQIIEYARKQNVFEFILKPSQSTSGGEGIIELKYQNGSLLKGVNSLKDDFLEFLKEGNWIIQERLENNYRIKYLPRKPLSCIRVLTISDNGYIIDMYASLKIAISSTTVDNAHCGGIYVGVNMKNGSLMQYAFDEENNSYSSFPGTEIVLHSVEIPCFEEVKKIAIRAARVFPDTKIVGWDIAVSNQGVRLIEGNSSPGLALIQKCHEGLPNLKKILTSGSFKNIRL